MDSLAVFLSKSIVYNRLMVFGDFKKESVGFFKTFFLKKNNFVNKIIFKNNNYFSLYNSLKQASTIHFVELELVGLGYRVSLFNKSLRLNLGFSHIIYVLIPGSVFFLKRKTKILVYSLNLNHLSNFVATLLRFKKLNAYKLKGLKRKASFFKLKSSKRTK